MISEMPCQINRKQFILVCATGDTYFSVQGAMNQSPSIMLPMKYALFLERI
jgi:hypothetical protein